MATVVEEVKPTGAEKQEDEEDFLTNLLDDMETDEKQEERDDKSKEAETEKEKETETESKALEEEKQQQKTKEVQRKYFEGLHGIFTDLDLTEIDVNGDNQIELDELRDYIKANNLSVPMYLAENIFRTIDADGNGFISPIEYLKWKTRVTVDEIARLTEVIVPAEAPKPEEEEESEIDLDDITIDDDDIELDDDDLFDVVAIMDEEEEKQEMDDMLREMEKAAQEKRIAIGKKKKEMDEEQRKRKQYAEEQRRRKEEEAARIEREKEEIEKARRALDQEKNEMEKQKKMAKLKELQAIISSDGDVKDKEDDDGKYDDESQSFDENDSTDSSWSSDDYDDGNASGKTVIIEEDNTCIKFCPCFSCCFCCNKPKITRQRTHEGDGEEKEKDIVKLIASTKRRLSKFIYKYGDSYVDDGTMVLSQDRLSKLTKDCDLSDKMGIYLWSLVLDKQSQKAYDCLWPLLRYLGGEIATPMAVELMHLYRVELSRYPPSKIEGICRSIVENSEFVICTALVIASFFAERGESDLANTRLLRGYSDEYQNIAAEELRQIESDYLATMTMMTKSFHNNKTPLNIAVDHELIEFLSSDRMGRIAHAMWVKRDLLRPEISENSFEVTSTGILAVVRQLPSPQDFYFTPIGFHFTETFLFFIYLFIFTAITISGVHVYDALEWFDWLLFACNFGYIFNEILQFIQEGPGKYFKTWENLVDIVVSLIWILIMFLRILAVILMTQIDSLSEIELLSGIDTSDSVLNLIFTGLWVVNIILLYIRCLHFLMLSTQEGPLINVMISMASDVKNWLAVFCVITVGFVFGTYFLVGDTNVYLETEQRALSMAILAAFGQPNWLHVEDGAVSVLNLINSWMIVIYSIVGFVLLMNLLIAMMAQSYSLTEGHSAKEVLLNRASLAFELDSSPSVMPPPLNSIVFVLFLLYNVIDLLVLAATSEFINEQGFTQFWRCRNKDCKFLNKKSIIDSQLKQGWEGDFKCGLCDLVHSMDDIFKASKRRFRRKARGLEGAKKRGFCYRLAHGFKEIVFVSKTKWKKHSWSCGYCRQRIPANKSADLARYFCQLEEAHNLDENDKNWIKSMNPQLCPYCYRPRRPRSRPTYILENISFCIFALFVYPLMWFILWPLYLYDGMKNPHNKQQKDYKEFRTKHNKMYSLRPEAATVRKEMPKSFLHQSLISLHHPIWRSLHKHRSTIKGQSLAQSIHSANLRQERVRGINESEKREKVTKISQLVMNVVNSMANTRIKWEPTGAELMERMSIISGVNIDVDWFHKHKTQRAERAQHDKLLLMFEASGGANNAKHLSSKTVERLNTLSAHHLRSSSKQTSTSMDFGDQIGDDILLNLNPRSSIKRK